jgi:hypothetical protein
MTTKINFYTALDYLKGRQDDIVSATLDTGPISVTVNGRLQRTNTGTWFITNREGDFTLSFTTSCVSHIVPDDEIVLVSAM